VVAGDRVNVARDALRSPRRQRPTHA
jgi:hypothetical protein